MSRRLRAISMLIMSLVALTSVAQRPSFDSYRIVDVLTIFGSGVLFAGGLFGLLEDSSHRRKAPPTNRHLKLEKAVDSGANTPRLSSGASAARRHHPFGEAWLLLCRRLGSGVKLDFRLDWVLVVP